MTNVEDLQAQYEDLYNKKPAARYKNDLEWLRNKIDKALEHGAKEVVSKPTTKPVNTSSCKTPDDVLSLGEEIMGRGEVGKFYSGAWQISIDNSGVSYKKL